MALGGVPPFSFDYWFSASHKFRYRRLTTLPYFVGTSEMLESQHIRSPYNSALNRPDEWLLFASKYPYLQFAFTGEIVQL